MREMTWQAPDQRRYRLTIAPMERGIRSERPGCDPAIHSLVFESEEDGWVESAPIHHVGTLWNLTSSDLAALWEQVTGRR